LKTTEEIKRNDVDSLCKEVLGRGYITLSAQKIQVLDQATADETEVRLELLHNKKKIKISTTGSGFIDAMFSGLRGHYDQDYFSLKHIKLSSFKLDTSKLDQQAPTASASSVLLDFSVGKKTVEFKSSSRSVVFAGYGVLLSVFQFYLNCELTFLQLRSWIEDAKKRNRQDIVSDISYKMSLLTQVNSYVGHEDKVGP
jgi:hypothetical protein